jgi:flagellar protein FlgJ
VRIESQSNTALKAQYRTAVDNTVEKSKSFAHELEAAARQKDHEKLHNACQELESVFLNNVFQSMLNSIDRSDFIPRGFATETFESMLYEEYAKEIGQMNATGIADILYRQLSQNL